jgi:hypothetical protein
VSESHRQLADTPLRTANRVAAQRSTSCCSANWRFRHRPPVRQDQTGRPQFGGTWRGALPSFPVGDTWQILRILAVLNEETGCGELAYETRTRLYFYLGFQRYVLLRWLNSLPAQGDRRAKERCCKASTILQHLVSSSALQYGAMDGQMYRDMLITLSAEIFALLQSSPAGQCQISQFCAGGSGYARPRLAKQIGGYRIPDLVLPLPSVTSVAPTGLGCGAPAARVTGSTPADLTMRAEVTSGCARARRPGGRLGGFCLTRTEAWPLA